MIFSRITEHIFYSSLAEQAFLSRDSGLTTLRIAMERSVPCESGSLA